MQVKGKRIKALRMKCTDAAGGQIEVPMSE
jgi:hypothetical protein